MEPGSGVTLAVLTLLALLLLAECCGRIVVARIALPIFESSPPFQVPAYPACPDALGLKIPVCTVGSSSDLPQTNATLAAALFMPKSGQTRGLVVFCPEFGADRWSSDGYCAGLRERGFAILAFDFRSQGDSCAVHPDYRPSHWVTRFELEDVLSAVRWSRTDSRFQHLPLYLMGVSRGAGAAVAAAAISPEVTAVVADGAFSPRTMMLHFFYRWARLYVPEWLPELLPRWYVATLLRPVEWIAAWRRGVKFVHLETALRRLRKRPVLMISGERDSYCLPRFTHRLQRLTRQDRTNAWIVPEARHNGARKVSPDTYDSRIGVFLVRATGKRSHGQSVPAPHFHTVTSSRSSSPVQRTDC